MTRQKIIETIGSDYLTINTEAGKYNYVDAAKKKGMQLYDLIGKKNTKEIEHYKLDMRFSTKDEKNPIVILIETKQDFDRDKEKAIKQLKAYLQEEKAVNNTANIIAVYACSRDGDDRIMAWKYQIDDNSLLKSESVIDSIEHYKKLFEKQIKNNQKEVIGNTYKLNELLHEFGVKHLTLKGEA